MANEKLRMAVKEMRAEGTSDIEIMAEVLLALKEEPLVTTSIPKMVVQFSAPEKTKISEIELMYKITEVFHEIGVPAHIKGYHYARFGIILAMKDSEMISCVTKMLYPEIAREFGTTTCRVERAIRHAIEVAWERGDIDVLNKYFGYTISIGRGKPTNSEFIAMIVDKLNLKYRLS